MLEKNNSKNLYSDSSLLDESLNLLEWDTLKTHLSSFASTKMGKKSILSSEIPLEFANSKRLLNETSEIIELENNSDKNLPSICKKYCSVGLERNIENERKLYENHLL